MVSFGNTIDPEILRCARALVTELEQHPFPGLLEFEASYTGGDDFLRSAGACTVFGPAGRAWAVQRVSGKPRQK